MATKKASIVSGADIAAARKRAKETRQQLQHNHATSDLLTPQERADAAPFYFVLRAYIQQLKEARESAGLTLAEVSVRTGMAVESLSRLETGAQTNPTWKTLGLYAVAVGRQPRLSAEILNRVDEKSIEFSDQSQRRASPVSPSRISRLDDSLDSGESLSEDAEGLVFLESIQIPEPIWRSPPNGWNFPAVRVFQVIGTRSHYESVELGDLTAAIYVRHYESYTDLVCIQEVKGQAQRLVQFAFRVFPDLCETPLAELSPLEIVKQFANRFGLPITVGSVSGKFIEKQGTSKRTVLMAGESQPSILYVDNPTNAACIAGVSVKEEGDRVMIALGFCINTTDYWKWFNSHI